MEASILSAIQQSVCDCPSVRVCMALVYKYRKYKEYVTLEELQSLHCDRGRAIP